MSTPKQSVRSRPRELGNILVDKPYRFFARFPSPWPQKLLLRTGLLEWLLRSREGVAGYELRHLERLRGSVTAGHGILLVSNHCRPADPMALQLVSRELHCPFYYMASWHVFEQGLFQRLLAQWAGAFSVYREGSDRRAVQEAIDVLRSAERPLVVFPEGTTSRTNDRLTEFLEGPETIARIAARRRKKESGGVIVCHPVAIKYLFRGDIEVLADRLLTDMEQRLTWHPQSSLPVLERLNKVCGAWIALKELEFGVDNRHALGLPQRRLKLIDHLLAPLEIQWLSQSPQAGSIALRANDLNARILTELKQPDTPKRAKEDRWQQLQKIDLAQQLANLPASYVEELPSVDRLLETMEKLYEQIMGATPICEPLTVVVDIGPAMEIPADRASHPEDSRSMSEIKQRIQGMLDRLRSESSPYCPKPKERYEQSDPGIH